MLESDRKFSIQTRLPLYFESISKCGSRFSDTYRPEFSEQIRIELIDHYSFLLSQIADAEKHIAGIENELEMSAEFRLNTLCQRIDAFRQCLEDFKANALRKAEEAK